MPINFAQTFAQNMETVRINVRRLATLVFASLIVPMAIALLLDFGLGSTPLFTICATVIFVPLSSLIVVRATLAEFEAVIQAVAPLERENPELHSS